jgi:hypothetical protein
MMPQGSESEKSLNDKMALVKKSGFISVVLKFTGNMTVVGPLSS